MNYEQDMKIMEDSLDIECLDQPELMMKYARHCAEMEKAKDEAKEDMEFVKSELDKDIRLNPEKYKLEKITDKVVESTIPLQERYIKASTDYLQAKYEWGVAKGAVEAMNARKDMLEALIRLNGQQYFAGPKIPHNLTELHQAKASRVDVGISSRIQRGK